MALPVSTSSRYPQGATMNMRSKRAVDLTNLVLDIEKENFGGDRPLSELPENIQARLKAMNILRDPKTDELESMRRALQKLASEKEAAEAMLQQKENELRLMTTKLRRVEELLKTREEEEKNLQDKLRKLQILKDNQPPPSEMLPTEPAVTEDIVKKKKRNSKKLKKPHTPFLLWCKDKRQEVCEANPTATIAALYVIFLEQWQAITGKEKMTYVDLYQAACEKYLLKVAESQEKTESVILDLTNYEDDNKQRAMSLIGQYLASKKGETMEALDINSAGVIREHSEQLIDDGKVNPEVLTIKVDHAEQPLKEEENTVLVNAEVTAIEEGEIVETPQVEKSQVGMELPQQLATAEQESTDTLNGSENSSLHDLFLEESKGDFPGNE